MWNFLSHTSHWREFLLFLGLGGSSFPHKKQLLSITWAEDFRPAGRFARILLSLVVSLSILKLFLISAIVGVRIS